MQARRFASDMLAELSKARRKFPKFNSGHEGYAIILEELEELWAKVMASKVKDGYDVEFYDEAKQVAAMAARFAIDLCEPRLSKTTPLVYIAHPLSPIGGETLDSNRANASQWVSWLTRYYHIAPSCSWIVLSGTWDESTSREFGLAVDKQNIDHCDIVVLTGGRISPGMNIEMTHALSIGVPVIDVTAIGYDAPQSPPDEEMRPRIPVLELRDP